MLPEILHYLLTPCSGAARRSGHLGDAVSLWSRAGRCGKAWDSHYARCHAAVARSMEGLPGRRRVLVLGSGLLRDVDLPALAGAFETVVAVDIVHLLAVRLRHARRRNVRWEVADLSGAHAYLRGGGTALTRPLEAWREMPGLDLVISANVLSQLPLAPLARARGLPAWPGLGRAIVENHLAGLREFGCRVCLLTDVTGTRRSRDGGAPEERDLLFGSRLPVPPWSWDWTLAPFGEEADDREVVHRCHAYPDFGASPGE